MANLFGKVSVGITASTGSLTRGLSKAASEIRSFGGSVKRIDIAKNNAITCGLFLTVCSICLPLFSSYPLKFEPDGCRILIQQIEL